MKRKYAKPASQQKAEPRVLKGRILKDRPIQMSGKVKNVAVSERSVKIFALAKRRSSYLVEPVWDADAGVYWCKSNIRGLHVEAKTLQEFRRLVMLFAPELVQTNHTDASPVPVIFFQLPANA